MLLKLKDQRHSICIVQNFNERTCGLHVVFVRVTHDEDVVATSERVPINGAGIQECIRVVPVRLSGGAAIEVPNR